MYFLLLCGYELKTRRALAFSLLEVLADSYCYGR